MKLNEKIAFYRRKLGYSQQTLADAMSVSRQSVSKWETGESLPEVTKLPQLAALFGVTTDFLLSEDAPAEDSAPPQPEKSAEVEDFAPERHTESGGSTADFVRAVPDAVGCNCRPPAALSGEARAALRVGCGASHCRRGRDGHCLCGALRGAEQQL